MPVEPSNTEDEWMPTTDEVRDGFTKSHEAAWDWAGAPGAFDRWLAAARAADAEEIAGYVALTDRQGDLLRSTVAVLRGAPPALTMWSHHDIPELAAAMKAERDARAHDIAETIRRNCTVPSGFVGQTDAIVAFVADWIENPPEWVNAPWRSSPVTPEDDTNPDECPACDTPLDGCSPDAACCEDCNHAACWPSPVTPESETNR